MANRTGWKLTAASCALCLLFLGAGSPAPLYALGKGERTPSFALKNLEGQRVTLDKLLSASPEKPLLVSFFATWCEPCQKEIPDLIRIFSAGKVSVVLISLDADASTETIRGWLDRMGAGRLPILLDPTQIAGNYFGVVSETGRADIPHVFLIGGDRRLLWDHRGLDEALAADVTEVAKRYKPSAPEAEKAPPKSVWIAFTNSANGWVLPCNCPEHPMSGLSRRLSHLTQLKAQFDPILLFDTGDNLPSDESDRDRCDAVARALPLIPYDAMVPGDQELMLGASYALDKLLQADRPYLTSNLGLCRDKKECVIPFMGHRFFDRNGLTIGVIGIFHHQAIALYPEDVKKQVKVFPWEKRLESELKAVRSQSDVVILLSHSGFSNDQKIAAKFPDIDVIVSGHSQELLSSPHAVGKTQIVEAGQDGAYVGKMLVSKTDQGVTVSRYELFPMDQDVADDPRITSLSAPENP